MYLYMDSLNLLPQDHCPQRGGGGGGGGSHLYDTYKVYERDDLKPYDDEFEAVWIEIKNKKSQNIIGCTYSPPPPPPPLLQCCWIYRLFKQNCQ